MRRYTVIGIGAIAALAAIVLLVGWLGFGWFKAPAAPVTFDVSTCAKFESTTGNPLDEAASNTASSCQYPAPVAPPAFNIADCALYDSSTGNPLDEAASNTASSCQYPAPAAPATEVPSVSPTAVPVNPGTSWTPAKKCEWLRANFPQTAEGVQSIIAQLAGVPKTRVAIHLYPCTTTETAYDGGIILGPAEGWTDTFTINVPQFGAVDAYPGAVFTGQTMQIGSETVRAFDGLVTAVRATYWPWLDEAPPIYGVPFVIPAGMEYSGSTTTGVCVQPTDLATQMGWKNAGWADQKYGGLRVELTSVGQLPSMWEAQASGRSIKETDPNREMVVGYWTIYPPFACREVLGYSK